MRFFAICLTAVLVTPSIALPKDYGVVAKSSEGLPKAVANSVVMLKSREASESLDGESYEPLDESDADALALKKRNDAPDGELYEPLDEEDADALALKKRNDALDGESYEPLDEEDADALAL